MISSVTNYLNASMNNFYAINSLNKNSNISKIINIANSSYKSNTYNLYNKSNAVFISNYTSTLANLKELNSKLTGNNKNSVVNSIAVSSSNENILSAKSFFTPKQKASYTVNVSQIAKAQTNTSNSLKSNDMSSMGLSTINITTKMKNYSFTFDTTGKTNKESLLDVAAKINKSNIGISAVVKEKDNKSVLELTGDKTGETEDFLVTGSEEFMQQTDLSSIDQAAQDAVYDITNDASGLTLSNKSSSNEIDIDSYRISATLKDAGQVKVDLNIDKKKVSDAVTNFVSAYNTTLNFLSNNANKGSGVSRQLENFKIPEIHKESLSSIGINVNKDGMLSLDSKVLNDTLNSNIDEVKDVLGSRNSAFSRIDANINSALRESSINLIDSSLYDQSNSSSMNDSTFNRFNLMNRYSNNNRFGMINYGAIGMFFNMFA